MSKDARTSLPDIVKSSIATLKWLSQMSATDEKAFRTALKALAAQPMEYKVVLHALGDLLEAVEDPKFESWAANPKEYGAKELARLSKEYRVEL